MGKAPADQFYWNDWLSDVELQSASTISRGVWINALCRMWSAKVRGELIGSKENLARLCNCIESEFCIFLDDAQTLGFCYVLQNPNGIFTVRNRRMYNNEKEKQNNRLRQQEWYKRHKVNRQPNKNLTAPSSSSSSSSSSNKELFVETSDEFRLSKYLFSKILENNPNAKKPNIQVWAKQVDLMLRIDKRIPDDIQAIIDWSQEDDFWKFNILGTKKLREQFDRLWLKMTGGKHGKQGTLDRDVEAFLSNPKG